MADRGFAKMVKTNPQLQRKYASEGGRKSGGQITSANAAEYGRRGGRASHGGGRTRSS